MIMQSLKDLGLPGGKVRYISGSPSITIGSTVVECLTQDRGAVGSNLTGITVLCPCP